MLNRKQQPKYQAISEIVLPNVEIRELHNNIKLHILDGGSQDIVKIDLLIKAGTIYADKKIIAPLTSLMLSEGTKTKNAQQIAENFDFYGAFFQAVASKDNAYAGLLTLSKYLPKTLPSFIEILTESTFPENEMTIQTNRMLNSFLIQSEKTSFLARQEFLEQLFGKNHPYGAKSKAENYKNITSKELLDFYKKHYHSANFELIVSGKIDASLLKTIDENFGKLPIGKVQTEYNPLEEEEKEKKLIVIEKPEAVQSSVYMGIKTINKTHPDYLSLSILITILGGYFGSRLMKNIREEKGYTYGIYSTLNSFLQSSYLSIVADVKKEYAQQTIDEIEKEIRKLQTEFISQTELELVRNYLMGEMLQALDGPMLLSEAYKSILPFGLNLDFYKQMAKKIQTISTQELLALANKYLKIEEMTKVIAGASF